MGLCLNSILTCFPTSASFFPTVLSPEPTHQPAIHLTSPSPVGTPGRPSPSKLWDLIFIRKSFWGGACTPFNAVSWLLPCLARRRHPLRSLAKMWSSASTEAREVPAAAASNGPTASHLHGDPGSANSSDSSGRFLDLSVLPLPNLRSE